MGILSIRWHESWGVSSKSCHEWMLNPRCLVLKSLSIQLPDESVQRRMVATYSEDKANPQHVCPCSVTVHGNELMQSSVVWSLDCALMQLAEICVLSDKYGGYLLSCFPSRTKLGRQRRKLSQGDTMEMLA